MFEHWIGPLGIWNIIYISNNLTVTETSHAYMGRTRFGSYVHLLCEDQTHIFEDFAKLSVNNKLK